MSHSGRHFWKSVLQHQQTEERTPESKLPLPACPEGSFQTWLQVGHQAGSPRRRREGSSSNAPSPHPARLAAPQSALHAWVGHRGPLVPALWKTFCRSRYLELLLSSVIIQHQLFLLLTADHGFPGGSSLSPLKRCGQSRLWVTAFLQGQSRR